MSSPEFSTELVPWVPLDPQPNVRHLFNPRVLQEVNLNDDEYVEAIRMSNSFAIAVCGFQWRPRGGLMTGPVCSDCKNLIDNV